MSRLARSTPRRSRIRDRIREVATPRAIALAVGLYVVLVVALQVSTAQVASHADGFTKPDLTFGYDHPWLVAALGSLGGEGRSAYGLNLVIDSLMPAAFAIATLLAVARAFPRRLGALSFAPAMFLVLDVVENASLGVMLARFPDVPAGLVDATSLVTIGKLASYPVAFATFSVALVTLLIGRGRPTAVRRIGVLAALALAVVVVVTLRVEPPAYALVGSLVAVAWGALIAAAEHPGRPARETSSGT